MTRRTSDNVYGFKGPTLQEAVGSLLKEHKFTGMDCVRQFNVGKTWYGDIFVRGKHVGSAHKLQEIYEYFTGEALIKVKGPGE